MTRINCMRVRLEIIERKRDEVERLVLACPTTGTTVKMLMEHWSEAAYHARLLRKDIANWPPETDPSDVPF